MSDLKVESVQGGEGVLQHSEVEQLIKECQEYREVKTWQDKYIAEVHAHADSRMWKARYQTTAFWLMWIATCTTIGFLYVVFTRVKP